MGCGSKTSNWNYTRTGNELASGPGDIQGDIEGIWGDIEGCIHTRATLPCVRGTSNAQTSTLKTPFSHDRQTKLFSQLIEECIFWHNVIMVLIFFPIKNISAHVILYFPL